jgi:hypothetical protein
MNETPPDGSGMAILGNKGRAAFRNGEQRHHLARQITPSLTFGFWIALLKRDYNATIWDAHASTVFAYLPADMTMKDVGAVGQTIKDLRNRIFHQEPLLAHDLSAQYAAILNMIEWICPETKQWVRRHTSVPQTIRSRP